MFSQLFMDTRRELEGIVSGLGSDIKSTSYDSEDGKPDVWYAIGIGDSGEVVYDFPEK